jgi:signal recognition particle subunit SRP14
LKFFTQLTSLLKTQHTSKHGSIYLTQKRLTYDFSTPSNSAKKVPDDPLWDLNPPEPLPILVRATNGKSKKHRKAGEKTKLSTIVQPDDIDGFFLRYADVCKKGMESMKKRDRSKKKKKKPKKADDAGGEKGS